MTFIYNKLFSKRIHPSHNCENKFVSIRISMQWTQFILYDYIFESIITIMEKWKDAKLNCKFNYIIARGYIFWSLSVIDFTQLLTINRMDKVLQTKSDVLFLNWERRIGLDNSIFRIQTISIHLKYDYFR